MGEFSRFVICGTEVVDASIVPERYCGSPGQCPSGVYDTLLVRGEREGAVLVNWTEHWSRFCGACRAQLRIDPPVQGEQLVRKLVDLCALSVGEYMRCRLSLFLDPMELSDSGGLCHFLVQVRGVGTGLHSTDFYCTMGRHRRAGDDNTYRYKLMGRGYVDEELAIAKEAGRQDVIFLNDLNEVCEGSYSNFWLIRGGVLVTPRLDAPCLPGIVRGNVLSWAQGAGVEVRESAVTLHDVESAEAIFLTSSIRGVQLVTGIDGVGRIWNTENLPGYWSDLVKSVQL